MKTLIVLIAYLFVSLNVSAQTDSLATYMNMTLEELLKINVVSASKTDQKLFETSANVTVITSADIELSGAISITDLLRNVPGLDVMTNCATGTDVGGRGLNLLENSKTLVLINGQRVNNDLTGAVKWMQIPVLLNNIERIEVLTSPISALYGANAFGALINIITKSTEKLKGADALVRVGEKETQEYQIGYGNSIRKLDFRFDISTTKSEGWGNRDSTKIKENVLPYVPSGTNDTLSAKIKDWYALSKATIDIKYNINSHSNLGFMGGVNFGYVSVPDLSSTLAKVSDNYYATNNFRLMLVYNNHLFDGSNLAIHLSSVQSEDFGGFYESLIKRYDADATYSCSLGSKNTLVSGLNGELLTAQSPAMDKEQTNNLLGLFVQDEYKINPKIKFTAGIRLDKHTELDWQYSPRITMNIAPFKNHYFRLGFGQAFRKPSFLENYFYQTNGTISIVLGMTNDDKVSKPEKITSYNLDYSNIIGKFSTKISIFKNYVTDLIDTKKVQHYGIYNYAIIYQNHGEINISGGEIELKTKPFDYIQIFANASYQQLDYKTEISGQKISVPEIKGNAGVQLNFKFGLFAATVIHYTGDKQAQYAYINILPDNTQEYYFMKFPANSTIDLNLGYHFKLLRSNIEFSVTCFNILDKAHIEYAVFDSSRGYFGLDTPARNYSDEMKRQFENRNALNDRKIMLSLKYIFL